MSSSGADAARDLRPLLAPRSVAVVGASEQSSGGRCLTSLQTFGFDGPLYPVNPVRDTVFGRPCFPSVDDLPEPVDCAAIAVPAAQVLGVLRQCVAAGVRAAVVHSGGFGAVGGEQGLRLQDELAAFATAHGLLLCGPNCMGIVAVPQRAALYFGDVAELVKAPRSGGLAILSHSGSLMNGLFRFGSRRGLRFTYVISSGNEAVLTAADYLNFLLRDDATRVVGAVLEQFRDPAAFAAAADLALALGKPLIVLKIGHTEAAQRAIRSHTGALAEAAAVADAFCRDRGILLVDSLEALCQTAQALLKTGPSIGRRLGVFTSSGGTCGLVADAASDCGFQLPALDAATTEAIREVIPQFGTAANPVDLAGPRVPVLTAVAHILAARPDLDTPVFAHSYANPRLLKSLPGLGTALPRPAGSAAGARPLVALFDTDADVDEAWAEAAAAEDLVLLRGYAAGLRALRAAVDYAGLRARHMERGGTALPLPRPRVPAAATRVAPLAERRRLLEQLGIPLVPTEVAGDAQAAVRAAERLGYPVALKLESPDLPHKSDVGAVLLDLRSDADVRRGFAALLDIWQHHLGPGADGEIVVQRMVPGGVEMLLGAHLDPHFGPVVACGLGGIYAESLQDVALGLAPLGPDGALRLLQGLRGFSLLAGIRGRPPADLDALARALAAISRAACADEIESLDINPLIALRPGRV